jgi:hypothetical protein
MSPCFNFGYKAGKPIEDVTCMDQSAVPENPTLIFILEGLYQPGILRISKYQNGTYRITSRSGNIFLNNIYSPSLQDFMVSPISLLGWVQTNCRSMAVSGGVS